METSASRNGLQAIEAVESSMLEVNRIECPCCDACYEVPSSAISAIGRDVICSNCDHVWYFRPEPSQYVPATDNLDMKLAARRRDSEQACIEQANLVGPLGHSDMIAALSTSEVRILISGSESSLEEFARTTRIYAVDAKGDTPLHIAARMGNLVLCDLFIRSGADPRSMNYDRQTPADVALAEGHGLAAHLLNSLLGRPTERNYEPVSEREILSVTENAVAKAEPVSEHCFSAVPGMNSADVIDDMDDVLNFDAAVEPQDFFDRHAKGSASGTFVALVNASPVMSDGGSEDWELDLSSAPIVGEGIGSGAAMAVEHGAESDFLKVRKRGRRSVKRAVVQIGTRVSIDPEDCIAWAEGILARGWCSPNDIDRLVANCEGNGDLEELRTNLRRNLEAAGFNLDQAMVHDVELWDANPDTSSDDLADAIEAALSRRTRLPGTQRFVMDKSDELQLLEPMMRAKQELQLGILASEIAVEMILDAMDRIREGSQDPGSVSLRSIIPSRLGHAETSEVMAAADMLRSWHTTGRVMDGKRRREALAALEALDLSLAFHKELVRRLEQFPAYQAEASQLEAEILVFESATGHLIREHLPYVRRFASRNVEQGEDPEDVFQVAFMGMQRSTRRFDPERGYRFLIYATYWMRQAITRWRADESAAIRIPVHRHEKITKLDYAIDKLDVRYGFTVSDLELAEELEWAIDEIRQSRAIPREAEYPANLDDWDSILPEPSEADVLGQAETESIVAGALAELPKREADVIRMRFGIGRETDMTLEEIGQLYGVTRERIRQIEAKGIQRLSHPARRRRLRTLLGYDVAEGPTALNNSIEKRESCVVRPKERPTLTALTEYQINQVKQLWFNGTSVAEIAAKVGGVSAQEINGELSRLGLLNKLVTRHVDGC